MKRNMANPKFKAKVLRKLARRVEAKRQALRAAKSVPCMDCGGSFPFYVMDLDHVRGIKKGGVGEMVMVNGVTLADFLAEIAKCDPVCANCHRIRTHSERLCPIGRRSLAAIQESEAPSLFDHLQSRIP